MHVIRGVLRIIMFKFFKQSEKPTTSEEDIRKLECEMRSIANVDIDFEMKDALKRHLFTYIKEEKVEEFVPMGLESLGKNVGLEAKKVSIPEWAKFVLRERVLDFVETSRGWSSFGAAERGGNKFVGAIASLVLVIFVVSIVAVYPYKVPVTYAKATYLDKVSGDVVVIRQSTMMKGEVNMALKEGDQIFTKGNSFATIRFFDDSLSRMGENTNVAVKRLYREPINPVITSVELYLNEGRVWTKVINLIDKSDFSIETDNIKAGVEKKAAFDLYSMNESTELTVLDNVVKLVPKRDSMETPRTIIAGHKAQISGDTLANVRIEKLPRYDLINENSSAWVAANLSDDTAYEESLIEDKEQMIGNDGQGALESSIEVMGEGTVLNDEQAEAMRKNFIEAYKGLISAEALLVRGAKQEGIDGLKDFKRTTTDIIAYLPELSVRNEVEANMLHGIMQEKVSMQLKDFGSFKPGNELYRVKEALQELDIALATTDLNRVEIQLDQAEGLLLEIEGLLKDGKTNLASSLLKRYQNKINSISLRLSEDNKEQISESFMTIAERQVQQMKVLTAIDHSIIYLDHRDFRDKVRAVREDTLRKFVLALEQMGPDVPRGLMLEVKDLYDNYVDDANNEDDLINPAMDKFVDHEYSISFISPEGNDVSEDLGVEIIKTEEATADVNAGVNLWK